MYPNYTRNGFFLHAWKGRKGVSPEVRLLGSFSRPNWYYAVRLLRTRGRYLHSWQTKLRLIYTEKTSKSWAIHQCCLGPSNINLKKCVSIGNSPFSIPIETHPLPQFQACRKKQFRM